MVRTSSSPSGSVRPPHAWNAAISSAVFFPVGHGALRSRNSWRRPAPGPKPAAVTAFRTRLRAALAFVAATARNAQCRSSSVALSSVSRSRACRVTWVPGGGSHTNVCSPSRSAIHAVSAALSSSGIVMSSPSGATAAEGTARLRYSAKRRSSADEADAVPPSEAVSHVGCASARRWCSSTTSPCLRHSRTCVSARISSCRGVYDGASSKASGAMGQLAYGGVKPTAP